MFSIQQRKLSIYCRTFINHCNKRNLSLTGNAARFKGPDRFIKNSKLSQCLINQNQFNRFIHQSKGKLFRTFVLIFRLTYFNC